MKYLSSIILSVILLVGVGTLVAHAQSYTPLAPLPGTTITDASGAPTTNLAVYVSGVIKLLVALGAALAVLFAIIGGTQYVAASINPSAKNDAKERIEGALIGLTIILSSYLILNSINPRLVEFNLDLKPITPQRLQSFTDLTASQQNTVINNAPLDQVESPAEQAIRAKLSASGVLVNNITACPDGVTFSDYTKSTGKFCTTIFGLGDKAINGVIALKTASNAFVQISGGYELGHTTHGPGFENNLDISSGANIDNYIKSNGTALPLGTGGCGYKTDQHYNLTGAVYSYEGTEGTAPHWHVCY